jgi:hypothetical protein
MHGIATKLQVGTAACAIAAAASIVPVAAQAAPEISVPTAPVIQVLDRVPEVVGLGISNLPEFNFWWFGTPNPAPPPRLTLLSLDVPILTPIFGLLGLLGKEICIGGLSLRFGSYGGVTASLGLGC